MSSGPDPAVTDWVPLWDLNGGSGGGGGAPSGPAGGVLSGTYPDPGFAQDMATQTELNALDAAAVKDGDPAGGALGGSYPNPTFAVDMATQAELNAAIAALPPAPTTLPPSGPAGGVLGGSYPNPGFAADMATQAELDAVNAAALKAGSAAGGVLSGTFPNPGFAADMATQAELDAAVALAIPESLIDATGDLIVGMAPDLAARLPISPTDNYVLTADLAQPLKVRWAQQQGVPVALIDAAGDLIVGSADNTPARLPAPATDTHVLTADLAQPLKMKWAAVPAAGSVTNIVLVRNAANFNLPPLALTLLTWSQEDIDPAGMHDNVNPSRITFKEAGVYDVDLRVVIDSTFSTASYIELRLNGTTQIDKHDALGTGSNASLDEFSMRILRLFAVNDYIEARFSMQASGSRQMMPVSYFYSRKVS